MSEQTKRRLPWPLVSAATAACLGLTVAAYALGIQPILDHRQREAAQQGELRQRRERAAQLGGTVSGLRKQLDDAKQALARTPLRLQPSTLVNQRLETVTQLATDCGVALDEMRSGDPADLTHYQTVSIRIAGRGKYPSCTMFLRKLRQQFGDMGIRSFQAGSDPRAQADVGATFHAELVWYTELPRK